MFFIAFIPYFVLKLKKKLKINRQAELNLSLTSKRKLHLSYDSKHTVKIIC